MKFLRALIVDDVPSNLLIIGKHLKLSGVDFDKAVSGLEALRLLESKSYDFIILDIFMPEMDGFETAEAIRAKGDIYFKTIPIIGISAETGEDIVQKAKASGMNDFIAKPFTTADLQKVIANNINSDLIADMQLPASSEGMKGDPEFTKSLLELTLKEFNDFRKNFGLDVSSQNYERLNFYKNNLKLPLAQYNMNKIVRYVEEFLSFLEKDGIDADFDAALDKFDAELETFCKELEKLTD
jgi:CheY-like chemotaxis protein